MITVGNRDANKGIGLGLALGFDGGGREMEETELEEGEACSYNNNNNNSDDYDASIDPDIALSYIDEKLQHVLGHFQKDFEGGVSAENLGAKFGGYGSFLPTYQRSPVWLHPRSPPKVQNHNAPPKSPNNVLCENGHRSSAVSSAAPLSLRPGPASSSTSLTAWKAPSINDPVKEEKSFTSSHGEEYAARHESENERNLPDQKTLKVRIKVGSDNLSTQKNAEIYSGLGLDVSPSSSLDDSPSASEGLDREPHDAPFESPTNIIQVMTLFPVPEGLLLSPLPDYLIHLTEKEKLIKDNRFMPFPKAVSETAHSSLNGSDYRKGDEKITDEKQRMSVEKNKISTEFRRGKYRDALIGLGATLKEEVDIGTLACEEIVTETLKLPLLLNSYSNVSDMTKGTNTYREACKSAMREASSLVKEEPSRPMYTEETVWDDNLKAGTAGKIWEEKKASSADDVVVYPRKDDYCKRERTFDSVKAESNVLMTGKSLDPELVDPLKQKADQRVTSLELDGKLPPEKEHQSSGVKKKSKGSQSHCSVAAELPKESSKSSSSSMSKNKKSALAENYMHKRETENRLPKDIENVEDRYREFSGDIESEQEKKKMNLLEIHSEDRPEGCEVDNGATALNNALKERSSGKRTDKFSTPETYPKLVRSGAPPRGPGPVSDSAQATTGPVLIEDNWVCCDKCQKWRLLPLGINPDNLPEKWLCSMLNWLPGMNRCSVSEEETTKALIALYQVPGSDSQNNLRINPGCSLSSVTLADVHHPDRTYRNFSSHTLSHGGNKKHGLKEIPNASKNGSTHFPKSMKKNIQASVKSESLNDMYHSPLASELDACQLSKSSYLSAEKHKYKQKEKHKILDHNSDGGDTKSLKIISKRDSDQENFRASKKIKTEDLNVTGESWVSEHGGPSGKGGPSLSNGLPTTSSGKEQSRHNVYSSKDSKSDTKDRQQVSAKKQKDKVKVYVDDNTAKKRKMKNGLDNQIYSGLLPSTGNDIQGSRNSVEEFSENDYRKEKKARVSKYEGKESSVSRGSGKSDKKGSRKKNQHLGQEVGSTFSQRSLNALDNKRNSMPVQPSVAATSSSSKVSGSHKNKASFHESKGSPVESVSSSPMRIAASRNLNGKIESHEAEYFGIGSPRKCPYDEDEGGSDRSGMARKEKSIVAQHGSLESVVDIQDKDFSHFSGGKAKAIVPSPDIANHHITNGCADYLCQDTQHSRKPPTVDHCHDEEKRNDSRHHAIGSRPKKSSKGSSSLSKDNTRSSKSNSVYGVQDHVPSGEVKPKDGRNKFQEKLGVKPDGNEKKYVDKKDSGGKFCIESLKRENQSSLAGHGGLDSKVDAITCWDATSTPKQSLLQDCNDERSSKGFVSDKTDQAELVSGRGKSLSLPPSGGAQNDTLVRCPRPARGSLKANGSDILPADGFHVDKASKVPKQIRKADHQNGSQHTSSRPTQNGHRARNPDASSPARKDSSSQAANNALKEAKDLKHLADRLKNSGSISESTGLYFQAALKFLHGASLLESSSSESAKHGDLLQSMTIYSSTAKLCEFCAHEYERSKDMAAAALAYKCMEVAYMRVIYSSHSSASRDRNELQSALQMAPGESPSSSASDVDNLNHPTTVDKVALPKGVGSPQVTGNHVIAARNRPNFSRLLNFVQDVNFAMEASRKSRNAFAAASVSLGEGQHKEGISSIKRALDFNFQDVEGLLRLVRLAMEAISR